MKIAIIGAGAMGSLFGARLAPLCHVWLVDAWEEHIRAIQRDGIQLTNLDGSTQRVTVNATTNPEAVGDEVDWAIIFVKSYQTAQAAAWAAPMLKAGGLALTMQNGLGNLEVMADVLGAERCVQGVTSHGATLLGPGQVRHAGAAATYLATRPAITERVQRIAELFTRAGFETHLSDNLDSLVWGKLVINVGINALTAILRVRNGVLAEVASARALMEAAVDEAVAVARARGITVPYADARARTREVALATAANCSSMLADVLRGFPTEIDVINGAIVREGARLGVPTPVNQTLVHLIKALEATHAGRVA
ncbi:MAG: 2-dehydropantoate 2-reductase [Anaerolineae bacterium]|nr:2-dehydropantoate 2-reductase [Anaerolineae bacterium]MDW8070447.1 2-dehydropantoate 2-reductase [Anaerolineae bacterium]